MTAKRLPRRLHLGRGYILEVVLASQTTLQDVAGVEDRREQLDGYWECLLGADDEVIAGRIYVHSKLSNGQRWDTYWHELLHAINDVMAWDRNPVGLAI